MGVGRSFSGGRRALISELLDEKIAYSTGLLPCRLEAHRKRMEVVVLPPFFATMLPECAAHSRNRLHRLRAAGFRSCLPGMENKRGMEPQEMKLKCAHERKRIILCIVRWIFVVRFRCSSFVNFHFKPSKIAIQCGCATRRSWVKIVGCRCLKKQPRAAGGGLGKWRRCSFNRRRKLLFPIGHSFDAHAFL